MGPRSAQADILSDLTQSELAIYNNGQNAYFTDIIPTGPFNGSLDLENSSGILSFSPSEFGVGYYYEEGPTGAVEGNYGSSFSGSSAPLVPEPSSLTLVGIAGLTLGVVAAITRGRRKAKAPAAV